MELVAYGAADTYLLGYKDRLEKIFEKIWNKKIILTICLLRKFGINKHNPIRRKIIQYLRIYIKNYNIKLTLSYDFEEMDKIIKENGPQKRPKLSNIYFHKEIDDFYPIRNDIFIQNRKEILLTSHSPP